MLPVGTLLQEGKYRIERYLASGGFGNTYVVVNTRFNAQMALKEFFMRDINERDEENTVSVSNPSQAGLFQAQMRKFEREAQRLYRLRNAHVVQVHDLFDENGTSYYVMDMIQGESLSARMKRTGQPMTESEVRTVLDQVLSALEEVHSHHIWHLDIKPGNILQDTKGQVVLIDFGASKLLEMNSDLATTMADMAYTPGYAPPEQTEQALENVGPWTDFYALGGTLYNLLTAKRPPQMFDLIENQDALVFPEGISQQMQQLVKWMMRLNRKARPQSVKEIRNFLAGVQTADDEATVVEEHSKQPLSEETQIIGKAMDTPQQESPKPTTTRQEPPTATKKTDSAPDEPEIVYVRRRHPIRKFLLCMFVFGLICSGLAAAGDWIAKQTYGFSTAERDTILANLKANMVQVEGGTFTMGETTGDKVTYKTNAMPAHQVTVSSFCIGKYEVTQEEWEAVMNDNPSYFKDDNYITIINAVTGRKSTKAKHPVEKVSWNDCQQFILKLNELTGLRFRLPTEAEWEYAAIGGSKTQWFSFSGSNSFDDVGWSNGNTREVGQKQPNELGLYDMSGNVK